MTASQVGADVTHLTGVAAVLGERVTGQHAGAPASHGPGRRSAARWLIEVVGLDDLRFSVTFQPAQTGVGLGAEHRRSVPVGVRRSAEDQVVLDVGGNLEAEPGGDVT